MRGMFSKNTVLTGIITAVALLGFAQTGAAANFSIPDMQAKAGYINTPDGGEIYTWGFARGGTANDGNIRYPGPPIDVVVGDLVTIDLTNHLPDTDGNGPNVADPVSIVFSGQEGVKYLKTDIDNAPTGWIDAATKGPEDIDYNGDGIPNDTGWLPVEGNGIVSGDREGLTSLTPAANPGESISYQFTANKMGTFHYYSGTEPQKHIDMGLFGAVIVRSGVANQAYDTADSAYDYEFIQLMSAMDPDQHQRVERGLDYQSDAFLSQYWFINGRSFPDTIAGPNVFYLPNQPESALLAMYPGERLLFRVINIDRELHPLHHHGNHATVIALNGSQMKTTGATTMNLAMDTFTQSMNPGESKDAIFTWDATVATGVGNNFGWDVSNIDPLKPVPVSIAPAFDNPNIGTNYGETYSGSAYLGQQGLLPGAVAASSINAHGEHYVPYHSHFEHQLENQGERPGGMLTLIMICAFDNACFEHATITPAP